MIDFYADWCSACKRLENETFRDPEVIEEAKRFVMVKIDSTDQSDSQVKNLQVKYGVVGLPTIVFIDSDGQHLKDHGVTQYAQPDTLLLKMRAVR
jgi:thiol:disulfide interchange protein DsbD